MEQVDLHMCVHVFIEHVCACVGVWVWTCVGVDMCACVGVWVWT